MARYGYTAKLTPEPGDCGVALLNVVIDYILNDQKNLPVWKFATGTECSTAEFTFPISSPKQGQHSCSGEPQ